MTEWTIRPASSDDRDRAVELLTAAHGARVRTEAEWDWLFRGRLSHYFVADTGSMLAAQYALLPLRISVDGSERTGLLSLDTATHPSFTRRGLMVALAEAAYGGPHGDFVFGFPNPASAPGLYAKLGWREVPGFPLYVRPLRGLFAAAATALAPVSRLLPRPGRRGSEQVEEFDHFGEWADVLWRQRSAGGGAGVVRDAAYLEWRYVDGPRHHNRYLVRRDGRVVGYAVARTVPWRHGRLTYILDASGDAAAAIEAVVRLADARESAAVVAIVTPRDPLLPAFLARRFRLAPKRVRARFSFGVRASGDAPLRFDAWHLTAGDFDHV